MVIITAAKLGRFLQEFGMPLGGGRPALPSPEEIGRFLATAERYGYWNATPEENAHAGIAVMPAASGRL